MEKKIVDYILVSSGFVVMVGYHTWLLHRIITHPNKTVIGINAINRRLWDASKNGVLAVQTLRNNIMASTLLASTAIMLCSLIAVLMTSGGGRNDQSPMVVFANKSQFDFSIKFFAILVCFLVAFLFNVQSIRYYSHASILINTPFRKISSDHHHQRLSAEYVATTVNRGSYFWSLGLRAFYFSFPLFLWIFGPVPMFSSSFLLVFMLYFLDVAFEFCGVDGNLDYLPPRDEEEEIGK
ncbi:uncharacterized protein LOC111007906 isoform X2 [Momordica charantia]|uniref:Uncharacterized protein LOC111007906 isoform X2 n=1 Tax=Momordica charantia TaxID=3673 RepID=A0A6J1C2P5_MOMCH|nr:uncharacterized protein LOC111007906 isoform X2 [Momordica charantia]